MKKHEKECQHICPVENWEHRLHDLRVETHEVEHEISILSRKSHKRSSKVCRTVTTEDPKAAEYKRTIRDLEANRDKLLQKIEQTDHHNNSHHGERPHLSHVTPQSGHQHTTSHANQHQQSHVHEHQPANVHSHAQVGHSNTNTGHQQGHVHQKENNVHSHAPVGHSITNTGHQQGHAHQKEPANVHSHAQVGHSNTNTEHQQGHAHQGGNIHQGGNMAIQSSIVGQSALGFGSIMNNISKNHTGHPGRTTAGNVYPKNH